MFPGEYLGLTGEKLSGAEMVSCGLATHYSNTDVSTDRLLTRLLLFPYNLFIFPGYIRLVYLVTITEASTD